MQGGLDGENDARTGMPSRMPEGAMCVQKFDDSRNSAIRITYRISLRSSSMPEPRDPLLKVLVSAPARKPGERERVSRRREEQISSPKGQISPGREVDRHVWEWGPGGPELINDPSAGSPTETLLRLLLPLNDQV
jgi:hypothetical protein